MKYLWLNQSCLKDNFNMQASGDFNGREYHIKVMDNPQFDSPKKVKRFRSAFTTDQVNYLEKQFKKFPYIGNAQRKEVAAALNIPERAVKIWFQNRRMKEKKDSTKEFDDEQGNRKSVELTKDPLNNLSMPSANEQPRSLPQLTNVNQETSYNNMSTNKLISNKPQQVVQGVAVRDSAAVKMTAPVIQNIVTTAKVIHPPPVFVKANHSPSEFKTSAEFSIGLCKKFKTSTFTTPAHTVPSFKKEVEDIKKCEQLKPVAFAEQMLPEDLSQSRKMSMPSMVQQQSLPANANNPGYVSLVPAVSPFYTQPYISASGVIWKPVSVMPVVTSSSSASSAGGNPLMNISPSQESVSKGVCNCNCHVKQVMPQVPYQFPQQSPNPQYIITAVPYQNPSTKF